MRQYTIVISDAAEHDTGFRGTKAFWWLASRFGAYAELGLYWFLSEYFGRSSVSLVRPSQLLCGTGTWETDWLFVGLPTTVGREHLRRVKFRRLVLYDSTDFDGINFGDSDKSFLLNQTNVCLKNWRESRWHHDFTVGLLPIKRPPLNNKLRVALKVAALKKQFRCSPSKEFDVGFVARPTGPVCANQRLRWLLELKRDRPELTLWGGLVGVDPWRQFVQSATDAEALESCWLKRRKIGFSQYFSGLCRSKVALAPAGYAPWTYRHFEAIYARCVVVSNDLSHYEFLIPFPRSGMIEVRDGESVVPAIDAALALYERAPEIVEANLEHLEHWLDAGRYSRTRRDTLDRFFAQLD